MNVEDRIFEVAQDAARRGGEIILSYYKMIGIEREIKDDKSFVTKADIESEKAIIQTIKSAFPDHAVLAEESGEEATTSPYQWIIDPLDGTANFLNGIPVFGVSIGVYRDGMPLAAAIYHPSTGEMYSAFMGKGAFYNGKPVHVSSQEASKGLVTFGMDRNKTNQESFTKAFVGLENVFGKRRHLGSTALEMAYIARGGVEATVSFGTKAWDHAAGAILVLEAGGTITDFRGNPWKLGERHFIATNGVCHETLLKAINSLNLER